MSGRFRHRQLFSAASFAGHPERPAGGEVTLAEVFRDFAGSVVAARAGDAVAGVGAVAAEVEMFYGGGVAGPAEEGAHGENLVEG